jgi:hypothetical protein
MFDSTVTLRFDHLTEHPVGEIKKIQGLVKAASLIDLINVVDLQANPRSAKVGPVTDAIRESIEKTPELFAFKTKGILLGASSYDLLERNRIRIRFEDTSLEGILDGGHNTLAIGLHILTAALDDDRKLKRVKTWSDFRNLWAESSTYIANVQASHKSHPTSTIENSDLSFLVPIELLLPSDPNDSVSVTTFNQSLLDICSARNNNVQLRVEAKANQSGYFDYLKEVLPPEISSHVEWKTNEGGTIKAADIVALAWIPLSVLGELPPDDTGKTVSAPVPQNIYRSKGECVTRFERLMSSDGVTHESGGKSTLINSQVRSALEVAKDIPALFDRIYQRLPDDYNRGGGKFRRITAVKAMNPENSRAQKRTKFTKTPVDTNIPEGFVVPCVYGLKGLMERDPDGNVKWRTDPSAFLERHLPQIVKQVSMFMAPMEFDPQKFGKEQVTYELAVNTVENLFMQDQARQ